MNQEVFKQEKFDFDIVCKGNEMEVSFPSFIEINEAASRAIKMVQQFGTKLILIFKEKRIVVDKNSTTKDVMEKYIFG